MTKSILFTYTSYSSFVKTDFDILSESFEVTKYQFKPVKGFFPLLWIVIKQLFFLLFQGHKYDAHYIWFADYHSFLPVLYSKIFCKKSFVVIGGYDAARLKSFNYGVFRTKLRGFFAIYTIKFCTTNLTVSNHIERKIKWIAPKAKTKMIYNCIRVPNKCESTQKRKDIVLTIGLLNSKKNCLIKGIDTILEVAKLCPSVEFYIIGIDINKTGDFFSNTSTNVKLIGYKKADKLRKYYQKAKIYCQLSRTESFGVALAEGMLNNCIPVVTNIGGMPEVVGNTGSIVRRDPKKIANAISMHLDNNETKGIIANKRIKSMFLVHHRKKRLIETLQVIH